MSADNSDRAKAWCFDNGVTAEQVQNAWDNAIKLDNSVINQLERSGVTWKDLSPHLLKQLIERYSNNDKPWKVEL